MRRLWLAFAALLSACSSGPPRLAETLLAPPPSPPLAGDCVISGPGDPYTNKEFTLYAAADSAIPVAVVIRPDALPATFSSIPQAPNDPSMPRPRAAFSFSYDGLETTAFVDLAARSFRLLEERVLIPDHLHADPGAPLRLWGRHDGYLLVTAETPFSAPKRLAFLVGCGAIGYGTPKGREPPRPRLDNGSLLHLEGGRLELFRDVARTPLFSVDVAQNLRVRALKDSSSMVFVRIEQLDDETSLPATVTALGWIDKSSIAVDPVPEYDSHGSIPDMMDRCPGPRILYDVEISVGADPPGLVFGTLGTAAHLAIVERRVGYVAIELEDGAVKPPPNNRWWVPARAVASDCGTIAAAKLDDLDGCGCVDSTR